MPAIMCVMFCLFSGPVMHQQPPSQQYSMPQGGGQHYQGQQPPMGMMSQVNQGNHMLGQRQIPPYRPPQQGTAPRGKILTVLERLSILTNFSYRQSQSLFFLDFENYILLFFLKGNGYNTYRGSRKVDMNSLVYGFIYSFLGKSYVIKLLS